MQEYLYVYGIVPFKKNMKFVFDGLREEPLTIVQHEDVAAVVSSYPVLNPVVNEADVMQHAEILKKLADKTTVIPTAFGTVFRDGETLEFFMEKTHSAIRDCLWLIRGKIELGVKVVKKDLNSDCAGCTSEILNSLRGLCIKESKADNFSDRLLLNCSFLVERAKFSRFSDEIAKLEEQYKELKFIYTGPWPPYSFININIRGENVHT